MSHQFEVDIAVEYGVNAAILFQNISFWCAKNRANGYNYFDGNYWTYNSRKAFTVLFPYLSERQIKTAIDKLVDDGMLMTGCYNKDPRDRSLWYAVTEKGWCKLQNRILHDTKMSNAHNEDVTPLPDNKLTDDKPNISISRKRAKSEIPVGFTEFWNVYPRKVVKRNAIKAWDKIGADEALVDTIVADVKRRLDGEWNGKEIQYIPHPSTYLNQRRWEDETSAGEKVEREVERDRPLEEVLHHGEDINPEDFGFTPCGGW